MKKIYSLFVSTILVSGVALAQQQPDNAGFENWDNVGTNNEEPTDWSGMMTGDLCGFCGAGASQRVFQDTTEVHGGTYSARIQSTSAPIGNIVVNGTITTGRVTAPSTTPSDGYNVTITANPDWNHPFTDMPDSLVFWAKYNLTDASDSARVSFNLHDDYGYRDPANGASASHLVASAKMNFQTGGVWERKAIAFDYSGPSTDPIAYLLGTFTSSYSPGVGNSSATLWVDDMSFVYNNITSVKEELATVSVYPNPSMDGRFTVELGAGMSTLLVTDLTGRQVYDRTGMSNKIQLDLQLPSGMYVLSILKEDGTLITEKLILR